MSVVNYKCPNCTASMSYDGRSQKMTCEYCGSSFDVADLEALKQDEIQLESEEKNGKEQHWEGFQPEEWQNTDMLGMKVWNCPSCGAEVIAEETTGAMKCPYCDNAMIMPEQFVGMFLPDYIIPFKKDKKDAVAALKKHYLGKPLLPKIFKDQNHMEEVKAVYVPFWMYDLEAAGRFRYQGINTRTYTRGDFRYVERRFYAVARSGKMSFVRVPVDGSKAIDDTMMEAIEPFDYKDLEPFKISYLSGYMANKYDVEPDMLTGRVFERIQQSMKTAFANTAPTYQELIPMQEKINISERGAVKYGLFPVWFLNTKWNGKDYHFVMNGQTGKLIGDLPVGKDLLVKYWFRHHIPLTVIMTAVMIILRIMGVM